MNKHNISHARMSLGWRKAAISASSCKFHRKLWRRSDVAAVCPALNWRAPPKPLESGKKSRWDVSEEKKKEDLLSDVLSAVHSKTEMKQDDITAQGTPVLPARRIEVKSADQPSSERKTEGDENEEEEEEESRPPMDLFKAIFAGSSDEEKSSSSSEGESNKEEDDEDGKAEGEKVKLQPATLFTITSSSSAVPSSQPTGAAASAQTTMQEEEFGPKLPPPSAAVIRGGATSICSPSEDSKPSRRSKDKKQKKNKNRKDKKKKKHKKHKHKAKQQKKNKESDSSSEDSDDEDEPVSTDELLRRLKTIRSHQTW